MSGAVFVLAILGVSVVGAPATFHPAVRDRGLAARLGAAYLFGALVLTVWCTSLSLLGIRWSLVSVGIPLVLGSGAATVLLRRQLGRAATSPAGWQPDVQIVCARFVTFATLGYLGWRFAATFCTSMDLLFFWGVKAVRFGLGGGFDASLLGWSYFAHAHVPYPPLHTIQLAWGALVADRMVWLAAPGLSLVWIAATAFVLEAVLSWRLSRAAAASLTSMWIVAMAASMVASRSAGNAEPPLVAFLTVACAAMLVWPPSPSRGWIALAALALAGAALSKSEGLVAALLLVGGAVVRDLLLTRSGWLRRAFLLTAVPLASAALWYAYLWANQLPLSDRVRERAFDLHFDHLGAIAAALPGGLGVGALTLPWWVGAIALLATRRSLVPALPAISLSLGVLGFALAYYLHVATNPTLLIGWTLPRLCQPALSAFVLWSGLAWFDGFVYPDSKPRLTKQAHGTDSAKASRGSGVAGYRRGRTHPEAWPSTAKDRRSEFSPQSGSGCP